MPEEDPYIKKYPIGNCEVRIARDSGKFCAAIYEGDASKGGLTRTDVLTAATPGKLEKKIERYFSASALAGELESVKKELQAARDETAKLTKSLNEAGDGNARAAAYQKDLEEQDKEIKALRDKNAQLEADLGKCQDELESAKKAAAGKTGKTPTKPDGK